MNTVQSAPPVATSPRSSVDLAGLVSLALGQHGVVHRRDLTRLGITRGRYRRLLDHGFLRRLAPDVFAVGAAPDTWEQRLLVGVLQLGPDALASSESAAALHGFDTFPRAGHHFLVPVDRRNVMVAGRVRSSAAPLTADDIDRVDDIPCTSPARTVFDLASVVSRRRLEHAIDSGLRDGRFDEADLLAVLTRLRERGRNGVHRMEEALAVTDGPVAHSVLERRFLRLVAGAGLPTPRSQVVFRDDGQLVARVDFLFEGVVIVEVEGHRFHATRPQRQRDNERRNALTRKGLQVLVFSFDDVRDRPAYVIREIRAAIAGLSVGSVRPAASLHAGG